MTFDDDRKIIEATSDGPDWNFAVAAIARWPLALDEIARLAARLAAANDTMTRLTARLEAAEKICEQLIYVTPPRDDRDKDLIAWRQLRDATQPKGGDDEMTERFTAHELEMTAGLFHPEIAEAAISNAGLALVMEVKRLRFALQSIVDQSDFDVDGYPENNNYDDAYRAGIDRGFALAGRIALEALADAAQPKEAP